MGHVNGTCGVTNLPILEEERVVLIPLLASSPTGDDETGSGYLENDVFAAPTGLHIRGDYDGYGGIVPAKNSIALDQLVSLFKAYAETRRLWRKKSRGKGYTPVTKPPTAEDILEKLASGVLALRVGKETPRRFGLMLVRETTFDKLVKVSGNQMRAGLIDPTGALVKKRHRAVYQLELLIDIGDALAEEELKDLDALMAKAPGLLNRDCFQYLLAHQHLLRRAPFAAALVGRASREKAVLKVLTEFLLFRDAFDGLRKSWQIQAGVGQANLSDFGAYYKVVADSIYEALEA